MCRKLFFWASFVLVASLALAGPARAELVAWWRFDDGSGITAMDSSGNGNDGTVEGDAQWVDGELGGALEFNGSNARVVAPHIPLDNQSFTIMMWINPVLYTNEQVVFSQNQSGSTNLSMHFRLGGPNIGAGNVPAGGVRMGFYSNDLDTAGDLIEDNNWYHITFWYDSENQNRRIYIDGVQEAEAAATPYLGTSGDTLIGSWALGGGQWFRGIIDDVQIYDHPLAEAEIQAAMLGLEGYPYASSPNPEDGALHADTWASMSWRAGDFAVSHDVYFGESFDDVNEGAGDTFQCNQDSEYFVVGFPGYPYPDGIVPGTTYYWRIDEVNEAEPNSPWKGPVWSFSVPPKTAYNQAPAEGAESVDLNVVLNWTAGFGAKLHYIVFGEDFDEVNEAVQGIPNGPANYNPGPLKLAKTYYWRVDEFDSVDTHKGEVWSFTTEGAVSGPNPADGDVDVKPSVVLSWDAGAVAASHEVYFGTDADAVANATTASPEYKGPKALGEESYDPGELTLNTAYYWRIDEVNGASTDSPWAGNVWSFTTGDFFVIDDFEIYDANDNQIWYTWHDGLGYGAPGSADYFAGNGTGAAVGDETTASYTEETIIHGGLQSMPLVYDNNKQGYSKYSEVEYTLTDQRDWTEEGVTELSLWFRGNPASVGSFTEGPVGTYTMTGSGRDIWDNADEFHYAYKMLTGVGSMVAKVESVDNTNVWAKAGVMIRESLEPGSVHATMVVTPAQGISFQRRNFINDVSSHTTTGEVEAPYWVKIERDIAGNFTAYSSTNGSTWDIQGAPENIQMGANVYIGLAVTSHDAALTCQAVFTNVTTTGTVSPQWVNQDIGIASNDAEPLYVTVSNSAGAPAVVVHDDPAAATIDTWTEWVIPLQAFADQGIVLTNVDRVAIGLGTQGNTTIPGGSGKMFFDDIRLTQPAPEPEPEP